MGRAARRRNDGVFLGTWRHRIDRKGRISIPARFRSALEADGALIDGKLEVALAPPLSGAPCVEGSGPGLTERLAAAIAKMNPLSPEHDALATVLLGAVQMVGADAEGRIVLPPDLRAHAELEDEAMVVGVGQRFRIWRPDRFQASLAEMRSLAQSAIPTLPWDAMGQARDAEA